MFENGLLFVMLFSGYYEKNRYVCIKNNRRVFRKMRGFGNEVGVVEGKF